MNILLTGSAGFIGSHVRERLLARGHTVVECDLYEPRVHGADAPAERRAAGNARYGDVANADAVIHLAAQVGVADSMTDPFRYITDNTEDTILLLQTIGQARANGKGPERVLVASSMSVYGEGGRNVTEDAPVAPASVYALTKYDQERLVLMYASMYGYTGVALRFFNVYGPRQALDNPYTGVLANFAKRLLAGQPPLVYEDGQQTRDFISVDDVADAVVAALNAPGGVYNVCTGYASTIANVAEQLALALGVDVAPTILYETRPGDVRHCTGSPAKAQRAFGFTAATPLVTGLREYAEWLKSC